ncbi:hypothetical protein ACI75Y_03550 [Capnocytophaga stomatis]|uniref:hypothetical protein n=1 Tax=Capnocytophaga stomatis TaxID=1848904 RepID=UPI0038599D57
MKIKLLSVFMISFLTVNIYAQVFPYSENQKTYTLWFLENIGVKSTEIEKFKRTGDIDALYLLELILKKAKTKEGIGIIYDFDKNLAALSASKVLDDNKKSKNNKTKEFLHWYSTETDVDRNSTVGYQGSPDREPYASSYYGSEGSGIRGRGLKGRSIEAEGKVLQDCNESGTIVVQIEVDRNGNVVKATPGVRGSTSREPCLLEAARKTAFKHKWNADSKAPVRQVGFIVINFKLGE